LNAFGRIRCPRSLFLLDFPNMTPITQGLIDIGKLTLAFAKVKRLTLRDDGEHESDTDHTVMLSLSACALADKLYKGKLDIGKVAQFALVHDLVEAYAGDTDTVNITDERKLDKEKREHEALERIRGEFGSIYPWIPDMIEEYEARNAPEARFVKTLDKAMTKITNTINKGEAIKKKGTTYEGIKTFFANQLSEYTTKYGEEFPELIAILDELMQNMLIEMYDTLH
jgi:putative hydrolase of HD superfamily